MISFRSAHIGPFFPVRVQPSSSDESLDFDDVMRLTPTSVKATRLPGRQCGSSPASYHFGDYEAAFQCFMEECPDNASGNYFLKKLQEVSPSLCVFHVTRLGLFRHEAAQLSSYLLPQRMPTPRTLQALQSFVSTKLKNKIREMVKRMCRGDLKSLPLRQQMALR